MKKIIHHQFVLVACFLLFANVTLVGQTKSNALNYSKRPYWIEMIKDPNVNYFEAVKAYDEFWKNRKKPETENDVIGEKKTGESKHRLFKSRKERAEEESKKYILEVKKFEHWQLKVKPYVQDDGHILTAEEQLKVWQEQRH
jgi:hypothetical protein